MIARLIVIALLACIAGSTTAHAEISACFRVEDAAVGKDLVRDYPGVHAHFARRRDADAQLPVWKLCQQIALRGTVDLAEFYAMISRTRTPVSVCLTAIERGRPCASVYAWLDAWGQQHRRVRKMPRKEASRAHAKRN